MSEPIINAHQRNKGKIPNEIENLPEPNLPKKSILDVLEEPNPDHRETLWGPDFRSFIPSPILNPDYAPDDIVKSLGTNNLEASVPQRSSYSCTFWIVVIVASFALIATGLIIPLVVLNNTRASSQAKHVATLPHQAILTDEKSGEQLVNYSINPPNTIISQENKIQTRDEKITKETDEDQAIEEQSEETAAKAAVLEHSKDRKKDLKSTTETPSSKSTYSKNLITSGLSAGLGMGIGAVIQSAVKQTNKSKRREVQRKKGRVNTTFFDDVRITGRKKLKKYVKKRKAAQIAELKQNVIKIDEKSVSKSKDSKKQIESKETAEKYFIKNQKKRLFEELKNNVKNSKAANKIIRNSESKQIDPISDPEHSGQIAALCSTYARGRALYRELKPETGSNTFICHKFKRNNIHMHHDIKQENILLKLNQPSKTYETAVANVMYRDSMSLNNATRSHVSDLKKLKVVVPTIADRVKKNKDAGFSLDPSFLLFDAFCIFQIRVRVFLIISFTKISLPSRIFSFWDSNFLRSGLIVI
jgi:hypothetical protein